MASLLNFKMGQLSGLKTQGINPGTIYVTTDEQVMYVDIPGANGASDGKRIRLGDLKIYKTFDELKAAGISAWSTGCLYYVEDENALAYFNGTSWALINDYGKINAALTAFQEAYGKDKAAILASITKIENRLDGIGTTKGAVKKYIDDQDAVVTGKVTTLEGRVGTLEGTVGEHTEDIADLTGQISAINEILGGAGSGSITETIDGRIDTKINALDNNGVSNTGHPITVKVTQENGLVNKVEVSGNFDTTYAKSADVANTVSELNGLITANADAISDEAEARAAADTELDKKITAHVNAVPGLISTAKGEAIAAAKTETEKQVGALSNTVNGIDGRVGKAEEEIGKLKQKDNDLQSAVDGHSQILKDVSNVKTHVETAINNLRTEVNGYTDTEIGKAKTALQANITSNAEAIQELQATDVDHTARLAAVEGLVGKTSVDAQIDAKLTPAVQEAKDYADAAIGVFKTNDFTPLKEDVVELTEALGDFKDSVGSLPTDGKTLREYIDAQDTADRKAASDALAGIETAYKAADTALGGRIDSLTNTHNSDISRVEEAIVEEKERAEGVEEKLRTDVDANKAKLTGLGTETAASYADKAAAAARTAAEATASGALNTAKAEIKGVTDKLNEDLAAAVDTLEKADTALGNRIAANEGKLAGIDTTVVARVEAAETYAKGQADRALAAAKTYADGKASANAGLINANTEEIGKVANRVTTLETTVNTNILNDTADKDGVVLDSFADVKAFVVNKIAANDAMKFMGTIGTSGATVTTLPKNAEGGHTYKVITDGMQLAGITCSKGDLLIALQDNPTANAHWAHVPSGGEDGNDLVLSSANNVISLATEAGVALGSVTIEGKANSQIKVEGNGTNKIAISLEWGTF